MDVCSQRRNEVYASVARSCTLEDRSETVNVQEETQSYACVDKCEGTVTTVLHDTKVMLHISVS